MATKYPLRKPLILTHEELIWLMHEVGQRYDALNYFLARGRKGQQRLIER